MSPTSIAVTRCGKVDRNAEHPRETVGQAGLKRHATGEGDAEQAGRPGLGAPVVERAADLLEEIRERPLERGGHARRELGG